MGFKMKGPSMNISYGGESNKQQKSDLLKDNPVAKHASAMNMDGDAPLEVTEEGVEKVAASDANPGFKNALKKALKDKKSPVPKKGTMAHMSDPGSALLNGTRNSGDKDTRTAEEKKKIAAANALRAAKIAEQHAAAKKVAKKSKK